MNKIIFFDTETTGNTEDDVLIELAYKTKAGSDEEKFVALYNTTRKIPPEASAVHHFTNKMLVDKPFFKESQEYSTIKNLFEDTNTILVAHNAVFDLAMMKKEDIHPGKFICTLRVARQLDEEEKIERYNLQYLRYYLGIEVDAVAHDAMGDVTVLEKLFERLLAGVMKKYELNEAQAIEKMIEISSHPSIFKTFKFGKYNGRKIEEVAKIDRGYLSWLLEQKQSEGAPDEDWVHTLKHFLGE